MSKYFTLNELCYSDTAIKHHIDNKPPKEIQNNLEKLMSFLDGIREHYGKPIYINSGYRCPALNKLVGGVSNSAHQYGWAVDLRVLEGLKESLEDYLKDKQFDQLIWESNGKSKWIHIGLFDSKGRQRRQIFTLK